ncbi:hypothetical protein [Alcanivorax sediminis]|uniref:Uncharacterized protein n=1 Tax=Alcanivorax sediminis TaxID=2663008 RepID=A0A6N7LVR8_9GAMM|nr:hypothetical protein [Alcanivorax sediminis]MQX53274.1 hypothetical protein [Alcanivorax sediminis]
MWPTKSYKASVCLGRTGVAVALQPGKDSEVQASAFFPASEPVSPVQLEGIASLMAEAQTWLAEQVGRQFLEVSVYVADPLLTHHVLSLEAWPASRRAQEELVRWRLKEEASLDQDDLCVVWKRFPQTEGEGVALQVMALPEPMREAMVSSFRQCHWPVLLLTSQAIGLNRPAMHDVDKGLQLVISDDYWLARHSENGRVSQIRCRWFGLDDQALEREIARSLNVEGVSRVQLVSFEQANDKAERANQQFVAALPEGELDYLPITQADKQGAPALTQLAVWFAEGRV